jgi:hypothetical protein
MMVIRYEVRMAPPVREKMALSAVELPMLIRETRMTKISETKSALIGISYESFACSR